MEDDDCYLIELNPTRALVSVSEDNSDDLVITREVGQVACRDYPHARHQCAIYPFERTSHNFFCPKCHCSVCDEPAPCIFWGNGSRMEDHCHATGKLRDSDCVWTSTFESSSSTVLSGQPGGPPPNNLLQDVKPVNPLSIIPVDPTGHHRTRPHRARHRYPLRPSIACQPYLRKTSLSKPSCVPRSEAFSSEELWGDRPSAFLGTPSSSSYTRSKGGSRPSNEGATVRSTALAIRVKNDLSTNGSRQSRLPFRVKKERDTGAPPKLLTNGTAKTEAVTIAGTTGEPVTVDNDVEEYEVERILDHRDTKINGRTHREYLVLWKGWSIHDSTWEPDSHLANAVDIVRDYLRSTDLRIKLELALMDVSPGM